MQTFGKETLEFLWQDTKDKKKEIAAEKCYIFLPGFVLPFHQESDLVKSYSQLQQAKSSDS